MYKLKSILLLIGIMMVTAWARSYSPSQQRRLTQSNFDSFNEFRTTMDSLGNIEDSVIRDSLLQVFWNTLRTQRQIPFVLGDSVAFLYRGNANSVTWAGDFNGWNPASAEFQGQKVGLSNIWMCPTTFPSDARLDYKIVNNGSNWMLDPDNPFQQWSGFGPNSELRMPDYIYPEETVRRADVPRGTFSANINIYSVKLAYLSNYRVYAPAGYDSLSNLPVIYVTDGHEYADDRLGSMLIVLDNLIAERRIQPIIAVFIDPRQPNNLSNNRRASEYTMNPNFADFVADELAPQIDNNYKTNPSADARAILGTSLGGINAAYFGIYRPDKFRLIGIHSPAFSYKPEIYSQYQSADRQPLKIFMSTGVIHDTESSARPMKQILESKGYPLKYIEINEGHSWGNWRALLDEPLIYFWGQPTAVKTGENFKRPKQLFYAKNYPNPFNPMTKINFYLSESRQVTLEIYNVMGQRVETLIQNELLPSGQHTVSFNAEKFQSGVYFYTLVHDHEICSGKMLLLQ